VTSLAFSDQEIVRAGNPSGANRADVDPVARRRAAADRCRYDGRKAAEHRGRIFEEFYQVPAVPGAARDGRGMGLGLAIVRRFSALLEHRVELRSRVGHGSRFSLLLARAPDARAGAPAATRRPSNRTLGQPLAGAVIAVIDDDPSAVDGMRALFGTWGATVAGGPDADEALAALGTLESYPDLIVADLRLVGRCAAGIYW